MKSIIKLAKELDFKTEIEYFDYLIESHVNGNFTQCKNLFKEIGKEDKKVFLNYLNGQAQHNGQLEVRNFYFDLI